LITGKSVTSRVLANTCKGNSGYAACTVATKDRMRSGASAQVLFQDQRLAKVINAAITILEGVSGSLQSMVEWTSSLCQRLMRSSKVVA
jgi:hypothetical protein